MILSAQSIQKLCVNYGTVVQGIPPMIDPFMEETRISIYGNSYRDEVLNISHGLGSCSYSIRLAQELRMGWYNHIKFGIYSTLEHFNIPKNICAVVRDKSTWARKGIAVQNTHIDPGWCGYLTLEISSNTDEDIIIPKGTGIAQIVFELLDEETELPYKGKYQNQGTEPQKAL